MAPQARGLPETLPTWFARQPFLRFVTFLISSSEKEWQKPVESVETLSLASLSTTCQVSPVQHWHRHKHQLVPLVPNLKRVRRLSKQVKQTSYLPTFFALAFFLNNLPWSASSALDPKVNLSRSSSTNSILFLDSSDSVSSERVTSRKLLDVDNMLWQMVAVD